MPRRIRSRTFRIQKFIIDHVGEHPKDIAEQVARTFGISRQAASQHLQAMTQAGTLENTGNTKARHYRLCPIANIQIELPTAGLEEHVPWQKDIKPALSNLPKNVLDVCNYGFTEILNNAIDHSGSENVVITCRYTANLVEIGIIDEGIGIFMKIKNDLHLDDELESIKQLAKGKLTTDPTRHSGEGIFFASRMFDQFTILSGKWFFSHTRPDDDWLIEQEGDLVRGTLVKMAISPGSDIDLKSLFDAYTVDKQAFGFTRTHIPVSVIQYGAENLVSRSQARRLLSRFDEFQEVLLDFSSVSTIGQAFADEIFRVYQNAHPEVKIIAINESQDVLSMIRRAEKRKTGEKA
jgi:anti-sigma regulatory factor (Ser/Thr protein kinase)